MARTLLILFAVVLSLAIVVHAASPYRVQAQALVAEMTQEEKLSMVHGWSGPYVGNVPALSRLGLPALNLEDGPQGVSDGVLQVTAWPSALTVVASWDAGAMEEFASAMALEERLKGTNIHLAPMVNIARVPVGGRNFESFGEDPALAAAMVRASITGIQSQGIIATVKHFVDNNQELNRTLTSADVPQRAQWEIYYPAFNAAVQAGVGAVMCSYNLINSTYACENPQTLSDLKNRMGFEGFVMSDWGATHSTIAAANAGLDMQMPDDSYFGAALAAAVEAGNVTQERLDDMVTRIVTALYMVGLVNRTEETGNLTDNVQSTAHALLAQQLAQAGTVLVQNNNSFLPLSLHAITSIAVLGDDGNNSLTVTGGGSGHVICPYIVSPLAAIQQLVGPNVKVSYAPTSPASAAAALAAKADVAIVFVATDSSEGSDRTTLSLGSSQDSLVAAVAAAQKNTAVVVHTPGAAFMPWASQVQSILVGFMPGQMDGAAIANMLFGFSNPSGRLPVTFPVNWPNAWPTPIQYPGINNQAQYSEDLLVGYRWYDANSVAPLFPFGHGLSYTTFSYSNIKVSSAAGVFTFTFNLANTGKLNGAEVPQLYIGYPASAGEPPRVLRAFSNIYLQAGASTSVSWQLAQSDLSVWNVTISDWSVIHGTFTAYIGASSRNFLLQTTFTN